MRVSDKMNYNQVQSSLNNNREKMANLQEKAATMKRMNKPSDDAVSATRILEARSSIQAIDQYVRNAEQAKNFLDFSERSLEDMSNLLIRAKEIALSQSSSGTSTAVGRRAIAEEVTQLYNQMNSIANRRIGDRFIFGGYQTIDKPFDGASYQGDSGEMEIEINNGTKIAMNMPGDKIFLGQSMDSLKAKEEQEDLQGAEALRGPASSSSNNRSLEEENSFGYGVDIFRNIKKLEVSLRSDDTRGVQDCLDSLDAAINQVVMARSELGSRLNAVTNNIESLQKNHIDNTVLVSMFEDADAYEVYSSLNQAEGNLKASLSTSSRLIQPSLLDFLR